MREKHVKTSWPARAGQGRSGPVRAGRGRWGPARTLRSAGTVKSRKSMRAGEAGRWAVEVRFGRVRAPPQFFCLHKQKCFTQRKTLGGPGRPVRGKSGQAGWPAGLGMPQASRTASEIVLLLAHYGSQNAQKCMNPKAFEAFGPFPLTRTCTPGQPGRPASAASASRRSWELVSALTP